MHGPGNEAPGGAPERVVKSESARRLALTAAKLAVSLGVIAWLLSAADLDDLAVRVSEMNPLWFTLGALAGVATMCVCALRWWRINAFLRVSLPLGFCQLSYFEGITISLIMPGSTAGDVVRVIRVGKRSGNYRRALAATVFDRIGNLGAIAVLAVLMLPHLLGTSHTNDLGRYTIGVLVLGALGVAVLYVVPYGSRVRRNRWIREVLKFILMFRRTFGQWRSATEITVLSIAGLLGTASMLYFAVLSVGVPDIRFANIAAAAVLGILASALPVSIAGLGVREGAVIWALMQFGYPQADAYVSAFAFGVLIMLQAVPGLLVWMSGALDRRVAADALAQDQE